MICRESSYEGYTRKYLYTPTSLDTHTHTRVCVRYCLHVCVRVCARAHVSMHACMSTCGCAHVHHQTQVPHDPPPPLGHGCGCADWSGVCGPFCGHDLCCGFSLSSSLCCEFWRQFFDVSEIRAKCTSNAMRTSKSHPFGNLSHSGHPHLTHWV